MTTGESTAPVPQRARRHGRRARAPRNADTTAAIAGQLAGAFHGARGIPGRWLQRLALRAEIQALADALHALNQGSDRAG